MNSKERRKEKRKKMNELFGIGGIKTVLKWYQNSSDKNDKLNINGYTYTKSQILDILNKYNVRIPKSKPIITDIGDNELTTVSIVRNLKRICKQIYGESSIAQ